MSFGIFAFLVGLFVLPLGLLAWGHRLRRLSHRSRRAFWGAILGHCLAGVLAMAAGMMFPEEWTAQDVARGFLGLWALLVLPAVGAAGAWFTTSSRS